MFQETKKIKTSIYNTYYYFIWYIIQIFYRILYLKIKNSINFRCNQTFPLKNQQIAISAKKNPLIEPKNSPSLRKQTFVKKNFIFHDHILIWFGAQIRSEQGRQPPPRPHTPIDARAYKNRIRSHPTTTARTKGARGEKRARKRQKKRGKRKKCIGYGIRVCVSWNFLWPVFMRPLTYETFYSSIGLGDVLSGGMADMSLLRGCPSVFFGLAYFVYFPRYMQPDRDRVKIVPYKAITKLE